MRTALIVLGVIAGTWLVISAAAMALFALASHWLNPHQIHPAEMNRRAVERFKRSTR